MDDKAARKYLYADLTWPEVNDAVELKKVILLPIGSTEQHGPHLPLDVDNLIATNVCLEAARRAPETILIAPTISRTASTSMRWIFQAPCTSPMITSSSIA